MSTLIPKTGNIFETDARGIGHGVNTKGVMGAGIALQFKKMFPRMYEEYKKACADGTIQPGDCWEWEVMPGQFVYNIASQDKPGPNARLEWLRDGVSLALAHAESLSMGKIALPRIGSGIGGLEEKDVLAMLGGLTRYSVVDIELWTLPNK